MPVRLPSVKLVLKNALRPWWIIANRQFGWFLLPCSPAQRLRCVFWPEKRQVRNLKWGAIILRILIPTILFPKFEKRKNWIPMRRSTPDPEDFHWTWIPILNFGTIKQSFFTSNGRMECIANNCGFSAIRICSSFREKAVLPHPKRYIFLRIISTHWNTCRRTRFAACVRMRIYTWLILRASVRLKSWIEL